MNTPQPTKLPTIVAVAKARSLLRANHRSVEMTGLLLEALLALLILLVIVWWTMFSGRPRGEVPVPPDAAEPAAPPSVKQPD